MKRGKWGDSRTWGRGGRWGQNETDGHPPRGPECRPHGPSVRTPGSGRGVAGAAPSAGQSGRRPATHRPQGRRRRAPLTARRKTLGGFGFAVSKEHHERVLDVKTGTRGAGWFKRNTSETDAAHRAPGREGSASPSARRSLRAVPACCPAQRPCGCPRQGPPSASPATEKHQRRPRAARFTNAPTENSANRKGVQVPALCPFSRVRLAPAYWPLTSRPVRVKEGVRPAPPATRGRGT